jgi:hypothetical protein
MPRAEFKPAIPATKRPKTYALDWVATEIGRTPCSGRLTYNGVLAGAQKGSFATLLSPPQSHAAFGTMPHTLVSVDHSPVRRPRALPLREEYALGLLEE